MDPYQLLKAGIKNPSRIPDWLRIQFSRRTWSFWEKLGFHLIPDHYYYPIPNLKELEDKNWQKPFSTEGIDMNDDKQLCLLSNFSKYDEEYGDVDAVGPGPDGDGAVYFSMIRELKPDTIIEVGSGNSTVVALQASTMNGNFPEIIAVDPYPSAQLRSLTRENQNVSIKEEKAEDIDPNWYREKLGKNDILFLDSSHVISVGNDIVHLFLRVLPIIPSGVFIHVHDIKFPYEYSEDRILKKHRFWNERYLLHAFLLFNNEFEIIWGSRYMYEKHKDKLVDSLPGYDLYHDHGGSFWIQRLE